MGTMEPGTMSDVGRAYGDVAELYIDLFASTTSVHAEDLDLIERHLTIRSGVVLDAGCGPGHLTAHLRAANVDAFGIDLVPSFIDHACNTDPDGRYALASIARLPLRTGSVAGILAWYSLIHLHPDDLDDVLVELRRVAQPGAPVVVGIFESDAVRPFEHTVATAYSWPIAQFSQRLRQAGFDEVERIARPGADEAGRRPHAVIVARPTTG